MKARSVRTTGAEAVRSCRKEMCDGRPRVRGVGGVGMLCSSGDSDAPVSRAARSRKWRDQQEVRILEVLETALERRWGTDRYQGWWGRLRGATDTERVSLIPLQQRCHLASQRLNDALPRAAAVWGSLGEFHRRSKGRRIGKCHTSPRCAKHLVLAAARPLEST